MDAQGRIRLRQVPARHGAASRRRPISESWLTSGHVREALREWMRSRDSERRDLEALRTAIRTGLDSGPAVPADQVFAELRARYAAKA